MTLLKKVPNISLKTIAFIFDGLDYSKISEGILFISLNNNSVNRYLNDYLLENNELIKDIEVNLKDNYINVDIELNIKGVFYSTSYKLLPSTFLFEPSKGTHKIGIDYFRNSKHNTFFEKIYDFTLFPLISRSLHDKHIDLTKTKIIIDIEEISGFKEMNHSIIGALLISNLSIKLISLKENQLVLGLDFNTLKSQLKTVLEYLNNNSEHKIETDVSA